MKHTSKLLLIAFLLLPIAGFCQEVLHVMIADSATLQSLPNVNIQVKNKSYGTASDARGFFKIQVAANDTLFLSMLGYQSRTISVAQIKLLSIVYMKEESRMLKTIEISADFLIPGLDKMEIKEAWRNPANTYGKVPGFQGIETFGPGGTFRGGELQHDREQKKLKELRAVKDKANKYIEIVNSPEVKDKYMKDFSITEEEYFRLLAKFNQKNKDFIYELGQEELTSLLFTFLSSNVDKK